ncbi:MULTISPECIES: hypothetical protein [Aeromicrobium]|jgi:cell division protein FtsB|uniref:hypothetical protein n=1 Tax=Aeromicrobium TaxID=2040 RepID=UPI0002D6D9EB|nr:MULTISPECIES: hypothetical protein [Aeromicrobium]TCJ00332.1 hypothetical protein E0W78_03845 [Aeromicrobium sp. IC_218]
MAKALLGAVGAPAHHQYELATLRRRVADLQAEVARLQSENDALNAALSERVDALNPDDLLESVSH